MCYHKNILKFKQFNSVKKNINIQQALFFSFLRKQSLKNKRKLSFNNDTNKNETYNVFGFNSI